VDVARGCCSRDVRECKSDRAVVHTTVVLVI
jgi:hypothetical protein